jgi:histidine triad (HIT) family protein
MYNHAPQHYVCPFCLAVSGEEQESVLTKQQDIIYRDNDVTAFVASGWWPDNKGHILVVPNKHTENVYNIPEETLSKVYRVVKHMAVALKVAYQCDGTSTRQHNEPAGGQDVWHFHVHVFPRYRDDHLYQSTDARKDTLPAERREYIEKLRHYFAEKKVHELSISHTFADYHCPICPAIAGIENKDTFIKQSDIVYRDSSVTAFISTFFKENNPGHVIIVPNMHYENIYSLPDAVSDQVQAVAKKVAMALKLAYHCDGISTAQHNEPEGDQHAFHYHFHVFPRYEYDDLYSHIHEKTQPEPADRAVYADRLRKHLS